MAKHVVPSQHFQRDQVMEFEKLRDFKNNQPVLSVYTNNHLYWNSDCAVLVIDETGSAKSLAKSYDNLYRDFRVVLFLGKILGIFPFSFSQNSFESSKSNAWDIVNRVLCLCFGINCVFTLVGLFLSERSKTVVDLAWVPSQFLLFAYGLYIYNFGRRRLPQLLSLLQKWNEMRLNFKENDFNLQQYATMFPVIYFLVIIAENLCYHIKVSTTDAPEVGPCESGKVMEQRASKNITALETHYHCGFPDWKSFLPFNSALTLYLIFTDTLVFYAWNYTDLLIILFSKAVSSKFEALYHQGKLKLLNPNTNMNKNNNDYNKNNREQWQKFAADIDHLVEILDEISKFLSPLVFLTYGMNLYLCCLQLNLGFDDANNVDGISRLYVGLTSLFWVSRIYLISVAASQIHTWSLKLLSLLQKCPEPLYTKVVQKTENGTSSETIGLTGLGCFFISNPLLLQIIGIVFTFEIILLQAGQVKLSQP